MELSERLWRRVEKAGDDECWPWRGTVMRNGYGQIRTAGAGSPKIGAHRAAYLAAVGPIPAGLLVCHRCDNRTCCNPRHLFLGTHKDNTADMRQKGRWVGGAPRGERNPKAKLTDLQRLEVVAAYSRGDSIAILARRYGIAWTSTQAILRRAGAL